MYYEGRPDVPEWQRKMAVQQWKTKAEVEPEVFERLVAFTYRFTGVDTSVARVYASLFWIAGGTFLFLLARRVGSYDAAGIATYYLFQPFGIVAIVPFNPMGSWSCSLVFWWAFRAGRAGRNWGIVQNGWRSAIYGRRRFFVIGAAWPGPWDLWSAAVSPAKVWLMTALGIIPAGLYLSTVSSAMASWGASSVDVLCRNCCLAR
jgi:hypothetical protein